MIAEVIVDVPSYDTDRPFDYEIPDRFAHKLQVGSRVMVPFGRRKLQGFVTRIKGESAFAKLRSLNEVLDETPPLTEELIQLASWMSKTYGCFFITAIQAMLPSPLKSLTGNGIAPKLEKQLTWAMKKEEVRSQFSSLKRAPRQRDVLTYLLEHLDEEERIPLRVCCQEVSVSTQVVHQLVEKGFLSLNEVEVWRDPFEEHKFSQEEPKVLTAEQHEALAVIKEAIQNKSSKPVLLHGVTGSGKTEIYLHAIQLVLDQQRQAILLVPEISLTPQMVRRFKGCFGDQVAVLHSGLSQGERFDEWRRIRQGEAPVVVGARSAIFAPLTKLGVIIIDEEHETTYKQEEQPRYHAREVAKWRADYYGAVPVMGSATPSLESYVRAHTDHYSYLSLPSRVNQQPLPEITIVDMREELRAGHRQMFSRQLIEGMTACIKNKEQIILFLNRRGYATFVMCRQCGYTAKCPHCDISLTYHRRQNLLRCHYCGYTEPTPHHCPSCQSPHIRYFGTGTQKVEEELSRQFPGLRILRMDVDTTSTKGSHERILTAFRQQEADVLLGTQMIAKGLDFPNVTLVGVIAADTILNLPDFRSAEKTFQLLTQVAGRAGRHQKKGHVVIQTYTPEHYSIQYAAHHDYLGFAREELAHRKQMSYPPFRRLLLITFSHTELPYLMKMAQIVTQQVRGRMAPTVQVLGPVASPLARIKDRYRLQCVIKYKNEPQIVENIVEVLRNMKQEMEQRQLMISIDVDPLFLM
ncbi:primosomal protein N' [Rubeoparvulum massiliense]|uniref:primosomal protein N' n=1 Tax=Rubeoparvulum massiliense TaxID=1631346 RepID=UPI00065DCCDA|nr:primosomal protein N' [Rubeoparvulum massiliense]